MGVGSGTFPELADVLLDTLGELLFRRRLLDETVRSVAHEANGKRHRNERQQDHRGPCEQVSEGHDGEVKHSTDDSRTDQYLGQLKGQAVVIVGVHVDSGCPMHPKKKPP